MNLLKELSEAFGLDRLVETYDEMHRLKIAEEMAKCSDGVSQVGWRDRLIEYEDEILDAVEGEIPEGSEPMLRVVIRDQLIEYLAGDGGSDE